MTGADILVESLIRHGVDVVFAYPGGASMPIHQSLTKVTDRLRTILPRHEQGGGFMAHGYSRSTGKASVCFSTSGPGATNFVTCIADAKMDSIPLIAITGQVSTAVLGNDAFQETPIIEICRAITKHHYLVTDVRDIPRIVKEAFYIAGTGRPGPVLIDVPKNVQLTVVEEEPDYDPPMNLPGYHPEVRRAHPSQIRDILAAIRESKKPIFYVAGSVDDVSGYDKGVKAIYEGTINADAYLLTFENGNHNAAAPMPAPAESWKKSEKLGWAPFTTSCVVLSLYTAAYCTEIVRGGISAVPATTRRAARSLGMTWWQDMRYIVAPLATRVSLPAWIGLTLGVMKDSALVLWLGLIELLRASQILVTRLQEPLFILLICGAIYFIISFPIARLGGYLERRWSND